MQSFDDPTQAVHVAVGEAFAVRLAGNPTTGYTWQANTDPHFLEPAGQLFEPQSAAVGAGGWEVLRFRALEEGTTEISCEYRRPWGGESRDTKRFQVTIA